LEAEQQKTKPMSITPNHNDTPLKPLKWYKSLATVKGRLEAGAFIIEGHRAIQQIILSHPHEIIEIISIEKPPSVYCNYPVRLVTESQFRSICSTRTPQGILAIIRTPVDTYSDHLPQNTGSKILLLEDIQDPGNVGTLIRTATAFDFSGVILTEKCADPFSPKCIQSTAGSMLSIWIRRTRHHLNLVESLKKNGHSLIATDLNGTEEPSVICQQDKLLLALGNEASGLSRPLLNLAEHRLRIPITREKAESLNVAVCGAILMYLSST
jgi:TrmH family RNA methyltransferase